MGDDSGFQEVAKKGRRPQKKKGEGAAGMCASHAVICLGVVWEPWWQLFCGEGVRLRVVWEAVL